MQTIPEGTQIALITRVVDGEIFQFNDCKHFNELLLLKGFDLVTTFCQTLNMRTTYQAHKDMQEKPKKTFGTKKN